MDATFGTNDVKFHVFILMVFDSHWTKIPIAWIVISQQTQNDLIEWLAPLKGKLCSRMLGWKLACFLLCRNPTLAKCGGEAQHLEKVGIGVVATLAFGLRLRQGG